MGAARKGRGRRGGSHWPGRVGGGCIHLVWRSVGGVGVLQAWHRGTGEGGVKGTRLYGPQAIARDTEVKSALKAAGVEARSFGGHLMFEPWTTETKTGGFYKVYTPFWRAAGLSGDAMSRCGPLVEIHDASPASGSGGALFGFIGVPPDRRHDTSALRTHVLAQLNRLFGPAAAEPTEVLIKDWALDPHTAAPLDHQPLFSHPDYGLPSDLRDLWEGKLVFAGTEVAGQFGGYLEGALEAAEAAATHLNSDHHAVTAVEVAVRPEGNIS